MYRITASSVSNRVSRRHAFTLVELLAVLGILGLLLAIILPAVQRSRAAARGVQCRSHLRQIGIATHAYTEIHRQIPGAADHGLLFALLPHIGQSNKYHAAHDRLLDRDYRGADVAVGHVETYLCPDMTHWSAGSTSYLRNIGLFRMIGDLPGFSFKIPDPITWADVTDGLSQTMFVSERVAARSRGAWYVYWPNMTRPLTRDEIGIAADLCIWESRVRPPDSHQLDTGGHHIIGSWGGYTHVQPPNHPLCSYRPYSFIWSVPARSEHMGGVNVLWADGGSSFISESIDRGVWWALGTINSGETVEFTR